MDRPDFYEGFAAHVRALGASLRALLEQLAGNGSRIAGYGAAAKATVLLNFAGLSRDLVSFVVDRSPHKQGRFIPGPRVPVRSPERLLETQPDYVLLLAWNLAEEVLGATAGVPAARRAVHHPRPGGPNRLMIFTETKLAGAYVVEADRFEDERGYFERTFVREEFEARGLDTRIVQTAVSYNRQKGTIRGMHYQVDPYGQAKLVRCVRGAIYDVIIDLRATRPRTDLGAPWSWPQGVAGRSMSQAGSLTAFKLSKTIRRSPTRSPSRTTRRGTRLQRGMTQRSAIEWPLPATHLSNRDRSLPLRRRQGRPMTVSVMSARSDERSR